MDFQKYFLRKAGDVLAVEFKCKDLVYSFLCLCHKLYPTPILYSNLMSTFYVIDFQHHVFYFVLIPSPLFFLSISTESMLWTSVLASKERVLGGGGNKWNINTPVSFTLCTRSPGAAGQEAYQWSI